MSELGDFAVPQREFPLAGVLLVTLGTLFAVLAGTDRRFDPAFGAMHVDLVQPLAADRDRRMMQEERSGLRSCRQFLLQPGELLRPQFTGNRAWNVRVEPDQTPIPGSVGEDITLAGRQDTLFSDDATALIHQVSRGLPRQVNNLAVAALIACFAAGKAIVDESAARQAVTEVSAE